MKKFSFLLDERLVNDYFKPLRSKKDVLRLLMKSIKFMLVDNPVCEERKAGEVILLVSKMSRLFFISPEKKFSIGFPFGVIDNDNSLTFSSAYIPYVDSKVTSDVLSILANVACFEQEGALEFVDPIVEMEDQERNFWPFLLNLLMYEDGYCSGLIEPDTSIRDNNLCRLRC